MRKCYLEDEFGKGKLLGYTFDYNRNSCVMKEELPEFLPQFAKNMGINGEIKSAWDDCGATYMGYIDTAFAWVNGEISNRTVKCRDWLDKDPSKPLITYDVLGRKNHCAFPDYTGICGGEKQPWCYIEGGNELVKYGICTDLPKCQCGSTGLTYTDPLGDKYEIPANLQNLKGDKHADSFAELIDSWNANTPFDASK